MTIKITSVCRSRQPKIFILYTRSEKDIIRHSNSLSEWDFLSLCSEKKDRNVYSLISGRVVSQRCSISTQAQRVSLAQAESQRSFSFLGTRKKRKKVVLRTSNQPKTFIVCTSSEPKIFIVCSNSQLKVFVVSTNSDPKMFAVCTNGQTRMSVAS